MVYPESSQKNGYNYLKEYSNHFSTVEIDQWFWSLFAEDKIKLPDPAQVKEYQDSIPNDFKFTIKIPNAISLTNFYQGKTNPYFLSYELYQQFLDRIKPLQQNIGLLFLQFEYLNKTKIASLDVFLKKLDSFFQNCSHEYNLGIEIRNPSYLNKKYFEFLNQYKLSHVFVHGYYMPQFWQIYKAFSAYIKERTLIRLMGPDRSGIEKLSGKRWDRIVQSKEEEFDKIIEVLSDLKEREIEIYLNVNNHYEGSAPLTINRLIRKMEQV